eukprot:jgi/Botrbrau1/8922/Bobra.0148s0035.1
MCVPVLDGSHAQILDLFIAVQSQFPYFRSFREFLVACMYPKGLLWCLVLKQLQESVDRWGRPACWNRRVLPVGTMLTGVGELAPAAGANLLFKPGRARDFVLRRPLGDKGVFMLRRATFVECLRAAQRLDTILKVGAAVSIGVGVTGLLLRAGRSFFAWRKHRASERAANAFRIANPEMERPALQPASNGQAEGNGRVAPPCVVCWAAECDTMFPACRHICSCQSCGHRLQKCPVCSKRGKPFRVYLV